MGKRKRKNSHANPTAPVNVDDDDDIRDGESEFNPGFHFDIEGPSLGALTVSGDKEVNATKGFVPVDDIIAQVLQRWRKASKSAAEAMDIGGSPSGPKKKRKSSEEPQDEEDDECASSDDGKEEEEDDDDDEDAEEEEDDDDDKEEDEDEGDEDEDGDEEDGDEEEAEDTVRIKATTLKAVQRRIPFEEDPNEEKFEFSEDVKDFNRFTSFVDFKLSRAVLKALNDMELHRPTPVQSAAIPLAMASRDLCVCARTGSGKTVAFLVPLLERLLRSGRPTRPMTRALILSPTRELALQTLEVAQRLTHHCPRAVHVQAATGGGDSRAQEAALRRCPDVVVATPGRLIDHLCNAPSFHLRQVELLVLDEADKMLDENFAEQLKEVLRQCSPARQTLLFSATMTESVKDLATVSLRNPARVFINENTDVALRLQQEFVRVRPEREGAREAMVLSLVRRHFSRRTIVFVPTKRYCHRLRIVLALSGVAAGELHGNMKQPERLAALKRFANADTGVLVATDLASRGLDVEGVETVINAWLPATMKQYVHRVGRTARAGRAGRAISLCGEAERHLLKAIVRRAPVPVKARLIPDSVLARYERRLQRLEGALKEVLRAEEEARQAREAEQALQQAERALEAKAKAKGKTAATERRPRVDWFQEQKAALKSARTAEKKTSKFRKRKQQTEEDSD